ncbi:MAG: type III pantothenate kinase, partial [Huintestinicola sp.]
VIDQRGGYLGGMIMPGVAVSHDSLISRTSQLPKIALEPPRRLIGKNTVECLKSGILYGNAGAIDGLIDRINDDMGTKCTVVATGGMAGVITPLCRNEIIIDEELMLKGLMIIYEKNK